MLHEEAAIPFAGQTSPDQFIRNRSGSIQNKIRNLLRYDLIDKAISAMAFILNFFFYQDNLPVLYVNMAGAALLFIMGTLQIKTLKAFNLIADQGLPTRDSLSGILIFLRRKSFLIQLILASSQVLVFVPGLLIYFFMAYGKLRPMTGMSFFVFTTLCLIGTIMAFFNISSQLKYHIKHISLCLSDLNENSLEFASRTIEKQRKQDATLKVLIGLLLIFGFVLILAVLKSIVN